MKKWNAADIERIDLKDTAKPQKCTRGCNGSGNNKSSCDFPAESGHTYCIDKTDCPHNKYYPSSDSLS